ncbi:MAG: hypothetical protein HY331_15545 [Chloroflexi bacterium]|nr:hypothetical protein [Chloroflexota bacterium]
MPDRRPPTADRRPITPDPRPPLVAPPPMFTPFRLRGMAVANRVVLAPAPCEAAEDGVPDGDWLVGIVDRALGGAGLVTTGPVAVSAEGRITAGSAGLYRAEHAAVWARLVEAVHSRSSAKIAVQLVHAGRRGSTRPRREGLDRPLRWGNWPLLSASPLPYTPQSQIPRETDRADMDRVREDFVQAARLAREAGFDAVELHFAHGYLLADFISPLANRRRDEYGGSLENRLRYPLEVLAAVRAEWPADRPLAVAISADDGAAGGLDADEAIDAAGMLEVHGCDLVHVLAGQTTADASLAYGRGFLTSLGDRVRNGARVATLVGGYLTNTDEVNTILAAGRADLCIVEVQ